jgi:hypothetical protein
LPLIKDVKSGVYRIVEWDVGSDRFDEVWLDAWKCALILLNFNYAKEKAPAQTSTTSWMKFSGKLHVYFIFMFEKKRS